MHYTTLVAHKNMVELFLSAHYIARTSMFDAPRRQMHAHPAGSTALQHLLRLRVNLLL